MKNRFTHLGIAGIVGILFFSQVAAVDWVGERLDGLPCTGGSQAFGPWDFFTVDEPSDPDYYDGRWWEVSKIHAAPGLSYMRSEPFDQIAYDRAAGEFDYTLRAFPNQPQILYAVIELEFRRRDAKTRINVYKTPPECYLQRAMSFRPKQPHIYQLMALYLQRLGKVDEAISQYEHALKLDPKAAEVYYNLGLAHIELGNHDEALDAARKAYALGYPLPGLQNKLRRLGVWRDE